MIEYIQGVQAPVDIKMVNPADGAPKTGLTSITFYQSVGGGSFSTITPSFTETGRGWYRFNDGHATLGKGVISAASGSFRGECEYLVKPRVSREVFGGTIQYGGAALAVTFQMLDSNGNPVDGAVTGGAPIQEFRHTDYPWAPIYGAPVYEISPAGQGMCYFNDNSGYINAVRGTAFLRVVSTVKDASALVRFQIV